MALSEIDRNLIQRCLAHKPKAWNDFVDRFMGLVVHVVHHTAECRSIRISAEDRDDLVGEVFLTLVKSDFAILRRFRGESSLATYLTVVSRRVVVHQLLGRREKALMDDRVFEAADETNASEQQILDRDDVERLLQELQGTEAQVVRMYHLEGKSYREISHAVGMAENSIGPTLSRARGKMRRAGADRATTNP